MCAQFKRAFKRNDKPICLAVTKFIGHLVNQQVADDMVAFEIALLLLENPSGMYLACPVCEDIVLKRVMLSASLQDDDCHARDLLQIGYIPLVYAWAHGTECVWLAGLCKR